MTTSSYVKQVGQIFQKFECKGQDDGGYVRNVVHWSIPSLLEVHSLFLFLIMYLCSVLVKFIRLI